MKGEKKEEMIKGDFEIELKLKLKSKGRMSERGGKEKGKIIKKNLKRNDFFFLFVFFKANDLLWRRKKGKEGLLTLFSPFFHHF